MAIVTTDEPVVKMTLLLLLLLSLTSVEIQCQTCVSFMGTTLRNHSYINLTLVGSSTTVGNCVQCHTNLTTCCNSANSVHRGDWSFPNQTRVPFSSSDITQTQLSQRVDHCVLNKRVILPSGMYHCDITTVVASENFVGETVYVGLYASGGMSPL